jgi:hypothetical protein
MPYCLQLLVCILAELDEAVELRILFLHVLHFQGARLLSGRKWLPWYL